MIKKLDTSSRLLILLSLTGILLTTGYYFFSSEGKLAENRGKKIGTITTAVRNIRLRHSSTIHWNSVTFNYDCYEGDIIFSGTESYATIELISGDKIILQPNSLIALSKEQITLESGVIEVDLFSDKPIKLKTPNQNLNLKKKSRFQIIHTAEVKKVIPLEKSAPTAIPSKKPNKVNILIVSPQSGKVIPLIPEFNIPFKWITRKNESNVHVEFYYTKGKPPFLKIPVNGENLDLPALKFFEGIIYWKVISTSEESAYSSFYMSKETLVTPSSPSNYEEFLYPQIEERGLDFSWTTTLDFPVTIQIASDHSFQNIKFQGTTSETSKKIKISSSGKMFWRVGYEFQKNPPQWSRPQTFFIKSEEIIIPLEIKLTANVFDFTLKPSYLAEIEDKNNCYEYKYILSKDSIVIHEKISKKNKYIFNKMSEGRYSLKVIGYKNKTEVTGSSVQFQVKNSPSPTPPKIIKNKKKLYVFLEKVLATLIPRSFAKDLDVRLSWVKDELDEAYEIEILNQNNAKMIRKQTSLSNFYFTPPETGLYKWRVKSKRNGFWGEYSKYEVIEIEDKIVLLKEPLMVSPAPNSQLNYKENNGIFTFNWKEPHPDFKYFIELYSNPNDKPIKVSPVSGGSTTIRIPKKINHLWWRIAPQSSFGKFARETTKHKIYLIESKSKRSLFYLKSNFSKINSTFKQNFSKESSLTNVSNISGHSLNLNGEYWPSKFNMNHGINLGLSYKNLSSKEIKFNRTHFIAEYGYTFFRTPLKHHQLFMGFQHGTSSIAINETASSEISGIYPSLRYVFNSQFKEKWSFEINMGVSALTESKAKLISYNIRPSLVYKVLARTLLQFFVDFNSEEIQRNYSAEGQNSDFRFETQDLGFGVGVVWRSF